MISRPLLESLFDDWVYKMQIRRVEVAAEQESAYVPTILLFESRLRAPVAF